LQASFNHPNGIEAKRVDDNVILYINDATSLTGNCTTVPLNPVVVRKITIPDSVVSVNTSETSIPTEFKLYQNYPNPFNPSTKIQYSVISTQKVTLNVYDILGNEVALLVNEQKQPGTYEVEFNVGQDSSPDLSSGIYFYQLKSGNYIETKKMILMK
jgi:hypothetical protein